MCLQRDIAQDIERKAGGVSSVAVIAALLAAFRQTFITVCCKSICAGWVACRQISAALGQFRVACSVSRSHWCGGSPAT
jgi:hypothetical protein